MKTSAIRPLQERILEIIDQQSPLLASEVKHWLTDVDAIALDCGLSALLRSDKIALFEGRYSLKKNGAAVSAFPQVIDALAAPPTAEEEAAASLRAPEPKKSREIKVRAPVPEPPQGKPPTNGHDSAGPSLNPVIADSVYEHAQNKRQAALNAIEVLKVDLANKQAIVAECDEFLRLYERFREGAQ